MPAGLPMDQAGVTLIELLIVVVLAVILISIGMPSYQYVTTRNRMATEVDSLLGDLQYARSEAVRQGQAVTVCVAASTNPASPSCAASGTTTWQKGWIIFSDVNNDQTVDNGDAVLRIQNAFSSGDTFVSNPATAAITFNREGFANLGGGSTRISLNNSSGTASYAQCLKISLSGMMTTTTASTDSGCT